MSGSDWFYTSVKRSVPDIGSETLQRRCRVVLRSETVADRHVVMLRTPRASAVATYRVLEPLIGFVSFLETRKNGKIGA